MPRGRVCTVTGRLKLMGVMAVALCGGLAACLTSAEDGATSHTSAVTGKDVRDNSATDFQREASKSSPGGRIDGYLAGGRWREGSKLVDMPGQFKTSGERVAFHSADGKLRFACLENLNSERVARIVAESPPDSLDWTVQGTLTEFRNENYLLVTQAVISSRGIRGTKSPADRRTAPARGGSSSR